MNPTLVKFCLFVVGLVVGGLVVFGVTRLLDNESSGTSDSSTNGTRTTDSLQFLIVVSRHGNKVMDANYPLDPYPWNNTQYWPYSTGQLTPRGRVQEYNLGVKLRSLYNGFLNTTFYTKDVFACTDLLDRTMMSGELVMAGLFPPEGWQIWNQNVNWQPIPLFTNSSDHTLTITSCERAHTEIQNSLAASIEENAANITDMINIIYNLTSEVLATEELSDMYQKLVSEETEGYDVPSWTSSVYPTSLADYYRKRCIAITTGTVEQTRLFVGNLLEDMIDQIRNKSEGNLEDRKLSYYSGHDYSLSALQFALGVPRSSMVSNVKTGSALIIELHNSPTSSDYWLQVLYVDGSSLDSDPLPLRLSNCGNPCYLNSFLNYTQTFTNVSYEAECQSTSLSVSQEPRK